MFEEVLSRVPHVQRKTSNIVYALIDPRTRNVRYIGQCSRGTARIKAHATKGKIKEDLSGSNPAKGKWLQSLPIRKNRLPYDHEIVAYFNSPEDAGVAEILIIQAARLAASQDEPLLNLAIGGVGPMLGRKHTDEARAKIAAAGIGRRPTTDVLERLSEIQSNRSAEWRSRISESKKGHEVSVETRKKISESLRRYNNARTSGQSHV